MLVESGRQDSRIDWAGAITATLGLFGIVYGLSHAAQRGASWGDALTLVPLLGGLLLLGVFVAVERRAAHPLLPLRIVTDRTRAVSLVSMALIGAGMFAMFYFLGLFIQQVMGYSPILAGVSFLPFTLGLGAAAGASQSLVRRVDPRWLSGTGALMAAFGMWGFTQLQVDSAYWSHLFPYTVVIGLGMGMVFIPLTMTATHGVQPADAGAAASALNTAQQVGGAVGIAALTTVFSHFAAKTATTLSGQAQQLVAQAMAAGHLPANPTPEQIAAVTKPVTDQIQTVGSVHGFWVAAGMLVAGAILLMTTLTVRHAELQTMASNWSRSAEGRSGPTRAGCAASAHRSGALGPSTERPGAAAPLTAAVRGRTGRCRFGALVEVSVRTRAAVGEMVTSLLPLMWVPKSGGRHLARQHVS